MDETRTHALAAKVDAFANTLDSEEQAMLACWFGEEVSGFGQGMGWPGVTSLIAFGNDTTSLQQPAPGLIAFGNDGSSAQQPGQGLIAFGNDAST